MAGRGGKLPGSGAPKGNRHTVKHGIFSKSIVDKETRAAFDRYFAELQRDPVAAVLASAAVVYAQVDRVLRNLDADGFFVADVTDSTSEKGGTVTRRLQVLSPISDAMQRAARVVMNAHEVEKARKEIDGYGPSGDTVIIQLHPDLVEG